MQTLNPKPSTALYRNKGQVPERRAEAHGLGRVPQTKGSTALLGKRHRGISFGLVFGLRPATTL